ncbi:MAG: hypothetical protein K940chlam1_00836 [Candidatus Anoxychlamydiales bacterium]|nr:hypothetical protein [Candidatus Anoxychlamydiales bacterium]NGX36677.1 hypothetical protein [Candidatus Anoxychlamydiales bacterium]
MKLNVRAFTIATGITWGLFMLFLAWISSFGWGIRDVSVIAGLYLGYTPTFLGGVIGAIWGFIDGAIGGFIFSYFYNLLAAKHKKK